MLNFILTQANLLSLLRCGGQVCFVHEHDKVLVGILVHFLPPLFTLNAHVALRQLLKTLLRVQSP